MSESIYSPGLEGVVGGETAVSTLDGGLNYRGYDIDDLSRNSNYEEVAYLVLYSELPQAAELADFRRRLIAQATLPALVLDVLRRLPTATPMMDVMRTGTSLLAHWDPDVADGSTAANLRKAERLIARLPLVMAAAHRVRRGLEPVEPDAALSHAANILWLVNGRRPTERQARAMDLTLIMYAEHEFNASTFSARVISSTLSDLHSAVTGAIGALKGPLHGGANERVLEVLEQVGSPDRAEAWIRDALAKKVRVMGFGHRVYKTGDPRAKLLKPLAAQLAAETGHVPMEQTAEVIERIVSETKHLPPNLDWPSARIYHYLGLPVELYTPLFVLSRVAGWSAHVTEQLGNNRLIRPDAKYIGVPPRRWSPIEQR